MHQFQKNADSLLANWKYILEDNYTSSSNQIELVKLEELRVIDPCMGSGHILVYAFDILMQIYESLGYSQRDAVKSILENNLYGLDIDDRANQLAYFAIMMKARQYNRRIFSSGAK